MAVSQMWFGFRLVAVCSLAAFAADAAANIDLQWRTSMPYVFAGQTFEVGLYVVSDDDTDQTVAGLDAILSWDPDALLLEGKIDNGPYIWYGSMFAPDQGLDGLNADCGPDVFCVPYTWLPYNDGEAFYTAFAIWPPAIATPEGLLVTTIIFTAGMPTSAARIGFLAEVELGYAESRVLSANPLGAIVTGEFGSLAIPIIACGSHGDFDGDCVLDLGDFRWLSSCQTGPDAGPVDPGCETADIDGDGDSDLRDFAAFQAVFTGQ